MFGGLTGISAKEYGARVNSMVAGGGGGGHGGRSVPSLPGHAGKGSTTTPLCLCELQRQGDQARKK